MNRSVYIILLLWADLVQSQPVVVTVIGRYAGNNVGLDTIILENLSRPNILTLSPLPQGLTAYEIDLMAGKLLNAIDDNKLGYGVFIDQNLPGLQEIRLVLDRPENMGFSLYNLSGKLLLKENLKCLPGENKVAIKTGREPIYVLQVSGGVYKSCFKCLGDQNGNDRNKIDLQTNEGTSYPFHKSTPILLPSDFIYFPGDTIRFTTCKMGMYNNLRELAPQNLDTIAIWLSAPCMDYPIVCDFDLNTYKTVQIGSQCWFRENVRSKHYSDGVPLVDGTGVGNIFGNYTTKYWFDYDDNPTNSVIFGRLYTGAAVVNGKFNPGYDTLKVQGICPDGWHVPNDLEWMRLEAFLGMMDTISMFNWRGTDQGSKIKEAGFKNWGAHNQGSNVSGLTTLPSGERGYDGSFCCLGEGTWVWVGEIGYGGGLTRLLTNLSSQIYRGNAHTHDGYGTRCIKD